jgi:hypothetical protein
VSQSIKETISPNDSVINKRATKDSEAETSGEDTSVTKTTSSSSSSTTITTTQIDTIVQAYRQLLTTGFLTDAGRLEQAESALRKLPQYAGKEIFLYGTAHFFDNGLILVKLRHPQNPKYVDAYRYNGTWAGPTPEALSVNDNIQNRLISLNRFSFSSVAKVARICKEKASKVDGAPPLSLIFITIRNNEITWFPSYITGSRSMYAIRFNADGTLKSFKQE